MPHIPIEKNSREHVVVRASNYMDHDLIDARIFYKEREGGDLLPTKRGFAINVDLVPDLIDALEKIVSQQPSEEMDDRLDPLPSDDRLENISAGIRKVMEAHGTKLHWDSITKMMADDPDSDGFTLYEIRYCLVKRRHEFRSWGNGVYSC